jgi:hypothetical protein
MTIISLPHTYATVTNSTVAKNLEANTVTSYSSGITQYVVAEIDINSGPRVNPHTGYTRHKE